MQKDTFRKSLSQGEQDETENSAEMVNRNYDGGVYYKGLPGGIILNETAEIESQEHERAGGATEEEEAEKKAATKEPQAAENVSGVRKILHPAEALDSARHTAELIIKDAMDALQRTKQRLMEILPHSFASASSAEKASRLVDEAERETLGASEAINEAASPPSKSPASNKASQKNEKLNQDSSSKGSVSIASAPAMSFIQSVRQPSSLVKDIGQSRL